MIKSNYSELSINLTKQLDKNIKKKNGIFFSPQSQINKMLDILEPYKNNFKKILEPSCGSCEIINVVDEIYNNVKIVGVEYSKMIYDEIKIFNNDKIEIINEDFTMFNKDEKYDLIIGNPPFCVISKKNVSTDYYKYFEGRPNLFIIFIIKSLEYLNNNGILSFILPTSFINCLYYDNLRKHINNNYRIIDIINCEDNYIESKQNTILFTIQKQSDKYKKNLEFVLKKGNYTIFNSKENISKLNKLYENSKILNELDFSLSIGNITWNEHKNILTNDKKETRLIYATDIINNKLQIKTYNNSEKKNYIKKNGLDNPLLIVNRGYGTGNYKFSYCIINVDYKYLLENHLICIKNNNKNLNYKDELNLLKNIYKSFDNDKTKEFIELYFGNSAINATELKYILPIYI